MPPGASPHLGTGPQYPRLTLLIVPGAVVNPPSVLPSPRHRQDLEFVGSAWVVNSEKLFPALFPEKWSGRSGTWSPTLSPSDNTPLMGNSPASGILLQGLDYKSFAFCFHPGFSSSSKGETWGSCLSG